MTAFRQIGPKTTRMPADAYNETKKCKNRLEKSQNALTNLRIFFNNVVFTLIGERWKAKENSTGKSKGL